MNNKAFNLFTALVAFIIIMLTVILTNSMTQTEDKAISTLSDLKSQSEMQAVADLARGDALQVFIYNMRYEMETWLTRPGNFFPLRSGQTWDGLVNNYIATNFGSTVIDPVTRKPKAQARQFAFEVTQQMSGILALGGVYGLYTVDLKQDDAKMREALEAAISNSLSDPNGQTFFEVVGCEQDPEGDTICNPGTFYINLNLSRGAFNTDCKASTPIGDPACQNDAATYESLPKIIVQRGGTSERLEAAILPRSKLRIYVPLRIFRAVSMAKKSAKSLVFSDTGLRSLLNSVKLGLCDPNNCNVRQGDIRKSPSASPNNFSTGWDKACPAIPTMDTINDPDAEAPIRFSVNSSPDHPILLEQKYKPGKLTPVAGAAGGSDTEDMTSTMRGIVEKILCNGIAAQFDNPFSANNIECSLTGNFIDSEKTKEITAPGNDTGYYGYCAHVSGLQMMLSYKEDNDLYRVNKNVTRPYVIQIDDSDFYADYYANQPASTQLQKCQTTCDTVDCTGGGPKKCAIGP